MWGASSGFCEQYGVAAACMGSPIGKSPIADPIDIECERLKRIGDCALQLGTRNIRLFSFYPGRARRRRAAAID